MRIWHNFNPDGLKGNDKGIDIRAVEKMQDGSSRLWAFQSKREAKLGEAKLKNIVDEVLKKSGPVPFAIVGVLACNVTYKARKAFEKHALSRGIQEIRLIQAAEIECLLFTKFPDVLADFFGYSNSSYFQKLEHDIERGIEIKKQFLREYLLSKSDYRGDPALNPQAKWNLKRLVVRSMFDDDYSNLEQHTDLKERNWENPEFYDLYCDGLEFVLTDAYFSLSEKGHWILSRWIAPRDGKTWLRGIIIGRLPFRNIISIDDYHNEVDGDPIVTTNLSNRVDFWTSRVYRIDHDEHGNQCNPVTISLGGMPAT